MSFATVQQFRARFSERYLVQLLADSPATEPDQEALDVRIQSALDDGTAELQGYLDQIPEGKHPRAATLVTHVCKVAVYLLTLDRPGGEFEAIRNAYTDTIAFYTRLLPTDPSAAPPVDASADAPPLVFTDDNLRGYT